MAIVRHGGDLSEIISQKMGGKKLLKRDLTLVDDSLSEIRLTLWGDKAEQPVDWSAGPIVAFKGVRGASSALRHSPSNVLLQRLCRDARS